MKLFPLLSPLFLLASRQGLAATLKEEQNRAAIAQFAESLKKALTEPDLYKEHFIEGAPVSLNGEEHSTVSEAWDPMFAGAVKFDFVWEEQFVTETHVGVKCVDFLEYDNGCSAMYTFHNVIAMEDGKFASFRSFAESGDLAKLEKCMPQEGSEQPTEKLKE